MKYLSVLVLVFLMGCAHDGPVVQTPFPEPPPQLMEQPPELKTIKKPSAISESMLTDKSPSGVSLTTMIKITTENMGICNKYRDQIFGLQEWITTQQSLGK